MFLVAILADDHAYNAAVRDDPLVAEEANQFFAANIPWLREQPGFVSLSVREDHVADHSVLHYTFATAEQAVVFVAGFESRIKPFYEARGLRFTSARIYDLVIKAWGAARR